MTSNIASLISDNLSIWATAVERRSGSGRSGKPFAQHGLERLRELILDLAVWGKLEPQHLNDEPATAALIRLADARRQKIASGQARKPKTLEPLPQNLPPLPRGWAWTQLGAIAEISPSNSADDDLDASFVPMALVSTRIDGAYESEVRKWGEIKKGFTHFAEGDIGIAKITPCFENGKAAIFDNLVNGIGAGTTELHVARPWSKDVNRRYLLLTMKRASYLREGEAKMTGTAGQKRVTRTYFETTPLPIPPLAEQQRIVAKVDQLMALCDALEEESAAAMAAHQVLVESLLATLINSDNADDLAKNWKRLETHFDNLFTTEASLDALQRAILELAVQGKLVPQDPNDETIQLPEPRQFSAVSNWDEKVFEAGRSALMLPGTWKVAPLAQVSAHIVDCPHTTPKWTDTGKLCIRTNQIKPRKLDLSHCYFVSDETYNERIERLEPRENDILYIREGGILGVACRIPPNLHLCLGQRSMLIRGDNCIDPEFLEIVLNSPFITTLAKHWTTGGAAPRVNMSTVRAYPIPLPPRAEQHRIVAKVNDLIALCDALRLHLIEAFETQRRLADVIVERIAN